MAYLFNCLRRLLRAPAFWVAAAGAFALCLFSPIFYLKTDTAYSIFDIFKNYTKIAMSEQTDLYSYEVFNSCFKGDYFSMFAPVIVSIASVNLKADERNSGAWRYFLHRSGKMAYYVGSGLFYLLAGGMVLLFFSALWGIFTYAALPGLSYYSQEQADFIVHFSLCPAGSIMEKLYHCGGFPLMIAAQFLEIFIYGMVQSAAAMLVTLLTENKYLIICTPFFLRYALNQGMRMLPYIGTTLQIPFSRDTLRRIANTLDPEAVIHLFTYADNFWGILILNLSYLLVCIGIFCLFSYRKGNYEK